MNTPSPGTIAGIGLRSAWSLCLVLAVSCPSAAPGHDDHAPTRGEVRRIDADNGVLTIRHERIEHLDMPPMTMDFHVADSSLSSDIGRGATVEFHVLDENGMMMIHDLVRVD